MDPIYGFTAILLGVAAVLGLRFHKSRVWIWVDVLYYPLAAIGVALLFVSNMTARELLAVDDRLATNAGALSEILANKPEVKTVPTSELIKTSFSLITGISDLAAACGKVPRMDPMCSAAEKMKGATDLFTSVARSPHSSMEQHLADTCRAGDALLEKLRSGENMSSLVGEELSSQIKKAYVEQRNQLNYEATVRDSKEFESRALERIAAVRRAVPDDSEMVNFVFATNRAEVRLGTSILYGLFPCVVVPRESLDKLLGWSASRDKQQSAIADLQEQRARLQGSGRRAPLALWLQLNLWPFVLIAALALKFSKGVAGVVDWKPKSPRTEGRPPDRQPATSE